MMNDNLEREMKKVYFSSLVSILSLIIIVFIGGCMDSSNKEKQLVTISNDILNKLLKKTIFFGHRSVGFDIIDGISDIQRSRDNTSLKIVESKYIDKKNRFYHAGIGENGDPNSKIQDFAEVINAGIGEKVDIAFFKLCYVDFAYNTDPYAVFDEYKKSIEKLQEKFPEVCFIHVTTPLLVRKRSAKNILKGILGKPRRGYEDNLIREKYNEMLRDEYGEIGLVFDLARLESTYPDGGRTTHIKDRQKYYSLVPEYSSDGGHLNDIGRKYIAGNLIIFLAAID
jgi:hypothetical protein